MKTCKVLVGLAVGFSLAISSQSHGALSIVWDTPSVGPYSAGDADCDYGTGSNSWTHSWARTYSATLGMAEVCLDQGFTVVGWSGNETVTVYADFWVEASGNGSDEGDYAYACAEAGGACCEAEVNGSGNEPANDSDSEETSLASSNPHYSWYQATYTVADEGSGEASADAQSTADVSVTSD